MKKNRSKTRSRKPRKKARAPDTIKKEKEKNILYVRKWGNQFSLKYTTEEIEKLGDEMIEFFDQTPTAVYFTDFSTIKMISRQRIYDFVKKNDYFSHCYNIVKDIIISRFIKYGLGGKNAAFPIFGIKNIASDEFKDRQDFQHSGGLKIIRDDI